MKAETGQTVRIHYTGKLTDGEVFDSSRETDPLEFALGSGMVIPGFDDAVTGMTVGESKTVTIPAAEAYGESMPELIQELERDMFPEDMELEEGMEMYGQNENGQDMTFTIAKMEGDKITIDANHFLAGKDLVFDLELMDIVQDA